MENICDERYIVKKLNEIGIALSIEKDIEKLLDLILEECMEITKSDAGSLYIIEQTEKEKFLKFKIAKNFSRNVPFAEIKMPLDNKSLAGYSALKSEILNIKNVEEYTKDKNIEYNKKFQDEINYKVASMLVVPMKNYSQEVVGVIQLINKKSDYQKKLEDKEQIDEEVLNYTKDEEEIVGSLTSQASILLERTKLYKDIEDLFSSFVETMVATIDARDTTTSGHSRRLAGYTLGFAEAINRVNYGKYKDYFFSKEEIKELYYAALLHDVGKIGVREEVLIKRHRLTDDRMRIVKYKFELLRKELELKQMSNTLEIESNILNEIDEMYNFLDEMNKRGFIKPEEEERVKTIGKIKFIDVDNKEKDLLDLFEIENLIVKKGNLTDKEKYEMNSHVTYSYEILKKINWLNTLKNIPIIAGCHHEKIDGSGYPWGKKGDDIPLQSKIITILDIFEALTARDRAYKPPMPVEKAIQILEFELKDNHLDKDLFEIFIKEKIYDMYKEELDKIVKL